MDSGPTLKPKVTVKLNYNRPSSSRPASPSKSHVSSAESTFRPKARVNSSAATRKLATTTSNTVSTSASTTPRAGSPAKLTLRIKNGVVSPTHAVSRTLKSPPPTTPAPVTPEMRKTYSLRADDSRSRSGSITSLHHAASFSSFHPSSPSIISVSSTAASGSVSTTSSPRLMQSKSAAGLANRGQTSSPTLKIRSKVSNLAKAASADSASSPTGSASSPTIPLTRQPSVRTRAPSSSSTASQQQPQQQQHYTASPKSSPASPPPQFYPITTAVPAANPHRFATNRPPTARTTSPPATHHVFQSFSQPSSSTIPPDQSPSLSSKPRSAAGPMLLNGSRTATATAKVDPASIPLPPHSPPASAVSFSSRSSVSMSASTSVSRSSAASVSYSAASSSTDGGYSPRQKGQNDPSDSLRTTLDNLMQYTSGLSDDDTDHDRDLSGEFDGTDEEHEVKAAAKSNRKIADLEITNRSLLAINATLEATKHRQAKEIVELRRKLRESRLILPPRAYRVVKSSLDPSEIGDDEDVSDEEGDGDSEGVGAGEGDETYKRVKVILDNLLKTGQAALEKQVKDFPEGNGRGAKKVLSPEEVKNWHGTKGLEIELGHDGHEETLDDDNDYNFSLNSEADQDAYDDEGEHSELMDHGRNFNIPHDTDNDNRDEEDELGNQTMTSEDEVEAMTIPAFSPPSSPPPPPILITQPT